MGRESSLLVPDQDCEADFLFRQRSSLTEWTGRSGAHQIFKPVCYDTSCPSAGLQTRCHRNSSPCHFTSALLAHHAWLGPFGCHLGHFAPVYTPHTGPFIHPSLEAPLHHWQISLSLDPEARQHWWHRRSWRRQVRRHPTGRCLDLLFQGIGRLVRGWLHVLLAGRFLNRPAGSKLRWCIHGAIDHRHTKHDPTTSVPGRIWKSPAEPHSEQRLGRTTSGKRFEILDCVSGHHFECAAAWLRPK